MTTPIIESRNLTKRYGAFTALDGVSFELPEGAVAGLLGPNGAGKSTLMKTLLGFLPYSAGSCAILGQSLATAPLSVRQRVGYMPENDAFFPERSGLETVVYAGRLSGMPTEAAFSRGYEVLDFLGMDEVRHRRVDGYSVGLKQKIKLAQALVHGPKLCFLDEPLSGLDPKSRDEMMDLLASIGAAGVTLVISSHVLKDIERLCSSVLLLNKGKLLYSGSMADLKRQSKGRFRLRIRGQAQPFLAALAREGITAEEETTALALVLAPGQTLTTVWRAALTAGVQIRELRPAADSLEAAFLRLVSDGEAA